MSETEFEKSGIMAKSSAFFPLCDVVGEALARRGTLLGVKLGWHCHLTALTAVSLQALMSAGCKVFLSECNPGTSDEAAINYMREMGATVFTGPASPLEVLNQGPDVLSDTGFDLLSDWLKIKDDKVPSALLGAIEITTSGISRLREEHEIPIPVININDGRIKSLIENFHGVGDGVVEAVRVLTGRSFQGERALVVGYGRVGAGVAHYLKNAGLQVVVSEEDAVRRLAAHFDGFPLSSIDESIGQVSLLITATGKKNLIAESTWRRANDKLLAINVGHWREELGLDLLSKMSEMVVPITEHLDEYTIKSEDGKRLRIRVATKGDPANVALLTGSIEPTLIHLASEMLCIEYLVTYKSLLKPGELRIPDEVEEAVAEFALHVVSRSQK